jgi:dipeptidyl-peptidase-4
MFRFFKMFVGIFLIAAVTVLNAQQKQLTLDDVVSYSSWGKLPSQVQWLPDGKAFTYVSRNAETRRIELVKFDAASGDKTTLIADTALQAMGGRFSSYIWLPNEKGLLLINHGDAWVWDLEKMSLQQVLATEAVEELFDVSPDGAYLSFVRNGNLFVKPLFGNDEKQLTADGNDIILNGKFDWVYQEELVGRGQFKAYYWSPDGQKIAFLRFDQSPVPTYPLVNWDEAHAKVSEMRYPKAGDPNSIVKLGVVNVRDGKTTWIDDNSQTDDYFPRVYWLPDSKQLAYMRLDRRQQNLQFVFADILTGEQKVVISESDPHWINIGDYVYFYHSKPQFIWGSERSGFNHLYLYDYNGDMLQQITAGDWLVDDFAAVDEQNDLIYFTATEKDIRERHLYRVKSDGSEFQRLSKADGYHSINMSAKADFYLDYYSNIEQPTGVTIHRANGDQLHTFLEPTDDLADYHLPKPEMIEFTGDNGITYYGIIIKPVNFNPKRKYPVLVYTYGGPHAQVITNSYGRVGSLWHRFLAQQGYVIFAMDNRGAAGRGHAWETPIHLEMGKVELEDQLRGVAYLKKLPFVDEKRIGIWGWSYGGYMTLYAMTHSNAFAAGISGAPPTHWRNYDTAYTERYMGLPQENKEGYEKSAPVNAAENLHGTLLLLHGTGDDNVHMSNSIQMIDALIRSGKLFYSQFYPNQMHGFWGKYRVHQYKYMYDFLEKNLKNAGNQRQAE